MRGFWPMRRGDVNGRGCNCRFFSVRAILVLVIGLVGCGGDDPATGDGAGQSASATGSGRKTDSADDKAVDALIDRAAKRVQAGDAKTAVELLSQAIGNDAGNARAFVMRADIYARRKQDANALADYSAAIRVEPKAARWLNARGFFLFTRGKRDASLRDLDAAIALDAKYAEAYNNRGLVHVGAQEYDKAIVNFDRAIEADPKYVDAWNNRGFAHFRSGDHDKALADFDQALVCDGDFVMAYNNRALLRMANKDYRRAVADCSSAIERDGDNPRFYQLRRAAYRKLGKSKEALADGERLIWLIKFQQLSRKVAAAPQQAKTYIERARHLGADGRTGAAMADYQRAITAEPAKAVEAYLARARHWIAAEKWTRALDDCNQALKAGGGHAAWSLRGEVHRGQGDWDQAIADFTKARRFDDVVAETYARRGELHRAAGRKAKATADLKRAAELAPDRFGKTTEKKKP